MFIKDYLSGFDVPENISRKIKVHADDICKFLRDSGVKYFKRYTNVKKESWFDSYDYYPIIKLFDVEVYDENHLKLIHSLIQSKFNVCSWDNINYDESFDDKEYITIDIDLTNMI